MNAPALLPLAVGLALVVAPVRAWQSPAGQPPVFRGLTRTVPIYVNATDASGRFVLDLRRDEFEVRDDGRVQRLTTFTRDVQPLTAVVLLDGSRSMVNGLDTVITAADHFVVRLMPGDRALVGSFSDEIRFGSGFTDNRDEMARQVNDLFDLRIGLGTSLWDAVRRAAMSFEGAGEGRRVVVVFTDGDDTTSLTAYSDLLSAIRQADAMVYAVLIRGIERLPENRRGRRNRPQDLPNLTAATGGGYYVVNNVLDDLNSITTQIAEELHNQYVIGFVPENLDGRVHKLEVRVRRPHVKLRARESYIANPDQAGAWP
jgi:Ca-activated chloride channel family protein